MLGSAPRVMVEHVREADWNPDGSDLAIVRRMAGSNVSIFGWESSLSDLRIHQSHSILADRRSHRVRRSSGVCRRCGRCGDDRPRGPADGVGEGWISVHGLAWTRDGTRSGSAARRARRFRDGVYSVTPTGRLRSVLVGPTRYKVLDIAADGRVLIGHERQERVVEALMARSPAPIDVRLRSTPRACGSRRTARACS